jgi:DNA-binding transcriptional LysR family regulator
MLTSAGRELLRAIKPHLSAIDDATDQLRKSGRMQIVVVEVPQSFAIEVMTSVFDRFSSQHNQVDLHIHMTGTMTSDDLLPDVSIVYDHKPPQVKRSARLIPVSYLPACSPMMISRCRGSGFDPADTDGKVNLLLHKSASKMPKKFQECLNEWNINSKKVIYFESIFALIRATEQNMGIAIIPLPVSQRWLDSGALVPLNPKPLLSEECYWISLHGGARCERSARTFYQWMLDEFSSIAENISSRT